MGPEVAGQHQTPGAAVTAVDDPLDPIERAQQRARAELVLAAARLRRWNWLTGLGQRHRVTLPPMEIDDEMAVRQAAALLEKAGVVLPNPSPLIIPTPDQWLAGHQITSPPIGAQPWPT